MFKKGFSLIEVMIVMGVSILLLIVVIYFLKDIFSSNIFAQAQMTAQLEGRKVLRTMTVELREATQSVNGFYPIENAATNTITFFADTNNDGISDKVRYFIDSSTKTLKRGVIVASGLPPNYSGAENLSILINDVVNGTSTNLFNYYDSYFAGTSSPMTYPISLGSIRLAQITVKINKDPNKIPKDIMIGSEAVFRNLKDNL